MDSHNEGRILFVLWVTFWIVAHKFNSLSQISMQLLHPCDLLYFLECSCVALCIAIHFQTQEGLLPLFLLWDCLSSSVGRTEQLLLPGLLFLFFDWMLPGHVSNFWIFHILPKWQGHGWSNCLQSKLSNEWSNSSGSCESLSWERCCGSNPRDSPIHSMGFLSRILLQGELLAKQKEIIIQMELGDRMLENKRLVYI